MRMPPLGALHLCAGNLYGGVERIVSECARSRALSLDIQPLFGICFDGRLSEELDAVGVNVARLGPVRISRPGTLWRARRELARLLGVERPAIVICHSTWMFGVAAPVVRRTTAQLVLWLHDRVSGNPWPERWARMTKPDLIIANSHFTAATGALLYSRVPTEVVYAPVSDGPPVSPAERTVLRSALGAGRHDVVILIASRFEQWKGHRQLLEGVSAVDGPWRIWIAGAAQRAHEAEYARALNDRARALGIADRVHFLGERTDVSSLMRAADMLCQPNTAPEPFGLTFVEALYAALPVVTTAMGGACEILTPECGVLVPPNDPSALSDSLQRLVRDVDARRQLGAAGPARARALCDPGRQLRLLTAVLRQVPALA